LQRVIRGIKRFQGDRNRKPKLPITLDILMRLGLVAGDLSNIDNAIFDAAKNLAWAGFLRCGEFTVADRAKFDAAVHLTRSSVRFFEERGIEYMELTIPASKTDPFRGGVTVVIAAAPNSPSTCPVRAMKHLFTIHPLPPTAPLFAKADSSPLRRSEFIRTLKARITDIGLDQSGYSGHSFRRGAATAAAIAGYADFEIQLLGRWRSDAYKLYLDVPKNRVLSLSARLHVAAAPPAVS
jgi:hypothetical protein